MSESFNTFLTKGAFTSKTDDWATPQKTFDKLNEEFAFTLDVAAAQHNHKCKLWFGLDHPDILRRDGLFIDWHKESGGGNIFMNPPYGKTIGLWTRKARETAEQGSTVVCLVPARTDTRWFHDSCIDQEIRFVKGRLKFNDGDSGAPFPSMIVVMKKH
jgi:phage N-6-adenine-methyltransferase